MLLAFHRLGDGEVNNQFAAKSLYPFFPHSLCKGIKVRCQQLGVKSCTEGNVSVECAV